MLLANQFNIFTGNGCGKQLHKVLFISVLLLVGLNRQTSIEPKIYKIGDMTQARW